MLEITYRAMKNLNILLVIVGLFDSNLLHIRIFYCEETVNEESLADESAGCPDILLYDLQLVSTMLIPHLDWRLLIGEENKLLEELKGLPRLLPEDIEQ